MRASRDHEGFTLVELVTTVTLIGVLAAIALPSYLGQRQKAFRAAMASDLHAVVTAQLAWRTGGTGYTADLAQLREEGFRPSQNVTAHVQVLGESYLACTQYNGAGYWLVYDSATATTSRSDTDCA